jgi:DNA-directed RNA polymerase subunit RPC12/RpoP
MERYVDTTGRDWLATAIAVALFVAVVLALLVLLSPWGLIVAPLGLLALVRWHQRRTAYRCRHCGHEFQISVLTDLISPHGVNRDADGRVAGYKLLRCPGCGRRGRATALRVVRSAGEQGETRGNGLA